MSKEVELLFKAVDAISAMSAAVEHLSERLIRLESLFEAMEESQLSKVLRRAEYDAKDFRTKRCETGFHDDCTGQVAGIWDCECKCHPVVTAGGDAD